MANNQVKAVPQWSIVIHEDLSEADNISTTICPLCSSRLRLYQIHYDEKFLMCGNIECAYPFGVTDCHIYKIECTEEITKNEARNNVLSTTGSQLSNSDWSDLTSIGSPLSPDSVSPLSLVEKPTNMDKLERVKKSVMNEESIKKNVQRIKELNKQLFSDNELDSIKNEKWIEHIAQMQELSGVQLLKESELKKVKKVVPKISAGELKIDIASAKIAIQIGGNEEVKKK